MSKKGVCDYRCWYAKHNICHCWCGGMNHGIGNVSDEEFAEQNSTLARLLDDPLIKKYGFRERQFERFMLAVREGNAEQMLESIKEEIRAEYKV